VNKPRRKNSSDLRAIAFDQTAWIKRVKAEARDLVDALDYDWESVEVGQLAIDTLVDNLMITCGHTDMLREGQPE
jgi:hypothetical protein